MLCSAVCLAQSSSDIEALFSPSVGQSLNEVAHELANAEQLTPRQIEQGVILLITALRLDSGADYLMPDLIRLASRDPQRDNSALIRQLFASYINQSVDLEVAGQAIDYLLGRLNSRDQREQLLTEMLGSLGDRHKVLASEISTELGLLKAEKVDKQAAAYYFATAYNSNNSNRFAFAKLVELAGDQIRPAMYLEHLRLALGENPFDIDTALAFAQYCEKLQLYDTAAGAYEYSADLFNYLHQPEPLPAAIYLPWALSSYNTERSQHKVLQTASQIRQSGKFDLLLEAIAGRAAAKIGNPRQSQQILKAAELRALELVTAPRSDRGLQSVGFAQLAWFYCFAAPDANEAVEWANRAYSADPNSTNAASILAYALVMNGQSEWAKLLIENYQMNQIAELALGQIQLAQKQRSGAIETLKSAIARDPGSLAAERAKEILGQQDTEYIPAFDPEMVLVALRGEFEDALVPSFAGPEKIISVQLKLRGDKFSYTTRLEGAVVITNNSAGPVIVSDPSLFAGNIRIDAAVTGDLESNIANLVSVRIRPALPIAPGASMSVPVQLCTGLLRRMLVAHPQADLKIEFTVFLDPVTTESGQPINRLRGLAPATAIVRRTAVQISTKYLQNRLDSLGRGRQGQKIKTAQLFAGLLMEQQIMAAGRPLYKLTYSDWMPELFVSALVRNLNDEDWVVRVRTMLAMLPLSLDYNLTDAVAKNLRAKQWPVRLTALFLLAKSQGDSFARVLDWTAKYDTDTYVRQMAVALGGREPPEQEQPRSEPPARQ
jgi:hypothetical protein